MKLTIEANDFCPDNCSYCEPEDKKFFIGNYKCKYRYICKRAFERGMECMQEINKKDKVYGYDVEDVILMATLLRQNKITPIEARDFRTAFSHGVEYMQKIYENAMREQVRNILDKSEVQENRQT